MYGKVTDCIAGRKFKTRQHCPSESLAGFGPLTATNITRTGSVSGPSFPEGLDSGC